MDPEHGMHSQAVCITPGCEDQRPGPRASAGPRPALGEQRPANPPKAAIIRIPISRPMASFNFPSFLPSTNPASKPRLSRRLTPHLGLAWGDGQRDTHDVRKPTTDETTRYQIFPASLANP